MTGSQGPIGATRPLTVRKQWHHDRSYSSRYQMNCGDILCQGILAYVERDFAYCPICRTEYVVMRTRRGDTAYLIEYHKPERSA